MTTITKHTKKVTNKNFFHRKPVTIVMMIVVIAFIACIVAMVSGVGEKSRKVNYYTQYVRIDEVPKGDSRYFYAHSVERYEVFTGVFHHSFGRVWHRKQLVFGEDVMATLTNQEVDAKRILLKLNSYDRKKKERCQ